MQSEDPRIDGLFIVEGGRKPFPVGQPIGPRRHSISELGWTPEEAARVRASLQAFDEDWNVPGMEAYDTL